MSYSEALFNGALFCSWILGLCGGSQRSAYIPGVHPAPYRSHCDLHTEQGFWSPGKLGSSSIPVSYLLCSLTNCGKLKTSSVWASAWPSVKWDIAPSLLGCQEDPTWWLKLFPPVLALGRHSTVEMVIVITNYSYALYLQVIFTEWPVGLYQCARHWRGTEMFNGNFLEEMEFSLGLQIEAWFSFSLKWRRYSSMGQK